MNCCCVKYCRFQTMHVTAGHQCGKCGIFGHGQSECGNPDKLNTLKDFFKQIAISHEKYDSQ